MRLVSPCQLFQGIKDQEGKQEKLNWKNPNKNSTDNETRENKPGGNKMDSGSNLHREGNGTSPLSQRGFSSLHGSTQCYSSFS